MWPPRLPDLTFLASVPCESQLVKATEAQIHEHDSINAFRIYRRTFLDIRYFVAYKVKQSRNRPGVANRVPGGLGSQIS